MTEHTIDEIIVRLAALRAVHPDIDPAQWMVRMNEGYNIDHIVDTSGKSNPPEIVECDPMLTRAHAAAHGLDADAYHDDFSRRCKTAEPRCRRCPAAVAGNRHG